MMQRCPLRLERESGLAIGLGPGAGRQLGRDDRMLPTSFSTLSELYGVENTEVPHSTGIELGKERVWRLVGPTPDYSLLTVGH